LTEHYRAFATRILAAAEIDSDGYAALTYLCDHIGNRNSGTPQLNTAVQWAAELMRNAGFENVAVQPVKVPHWVRGQEAAYIIAPINRCLHMIGLGMNVGTPKEGITAPVVFVHDYTEQERTIAPTGRRELPQKEPSGWAAKTLVLSSRRASRRAKPAYSRKTLFRLAP
jgi:hypothetical protein